MRRPVAPLLAIALGIAAPARADDRPVTAGLTSTGDPCLEQGALAEQISAWLERDAIAIELGVVVETAGGATTIAITRAGEVVATRRFDRLPSRCEDRRAAIGLAIALAIDAAILESLQIVDPPPPPPQRTDPERPPVEAPPPPPARAPPGERPALAIEAEAILFVELLPEVALAGAASVAALVGEGVRIRLGALATQRGGVAFARGAAEISLLAGRLDGCFGRAVADRLLVGGCVGVIAGAALAEGHGLATTRSTDIPWVLGVGRVELRWLPLDLLAFGVGIDAHFSVVRPRLEIGDGAGGVIDARSVPSAGVGIVLAAALLLE